MRADPLQPLLVAGLATLVFAATAEAQVVIRGTLANESGSPAAHETVYVAAIVNNRIRTVFLIDNQGRTSALDNPNAETDARGGFRIAVAQSFLEPTEEYTLGILDCLKCFTDPSRRVFTSGGIPWSFRLTDSLRQAALKGPVEVDVGRIKIAQRRR